MRACARLRTHAFCFLICQAYFQRCDTHPPSSLLGTTSWPSNPSGTTVRGGRHACTVRQRGSTGSTEAHHGPAASSPITGLLQALRWLTRNYTGLFSVSCLAPCGKMLPFHSSPEILGVSLASDSVPMPVWPPCLDSDLLQGFIRTCHFGHKIHQCQEGGQRLASVI